MKTSVTLADIPGGAFRIFAFFEILPYNEITTL